jgi:hypothetical protein
MLILSLRILIRYSSKYDWDNFYKVHIFLENKLKYATIANSSPLWNPYAK